MNASATIIVKPPAQGKPVEGHAGLDVGRRAACCG